MKLCPVCKSRCFDDMDTCYGCMHNFIKDKEVKKMKSKDEKKDEDIRIPEYFEMESFPYIEEVDNKEMKTEAKCNCNNKKNISLTLEIPLNMIKFS